MYNLKALFDSLPSIGHQFADNSKYFAAEQVAGLDNFRLGKDRLDRPVLLISTAGKPEARKIPPILLENVSVSHGVRCSIQRTDGSSEQGEFTIVCCTSDNGAMQSMFLDFVAVLLLNVSVEATPDEINRTIDNLVELLRMLSMPPRKSIQGLWSELFVITRAKKPYTVIKAWHRQPYDIYDFSSELQFLEVKSTASELRQHHFSLQQLTPPPGSDALVASLFVRRSQNGKSIWDLLEALRRKVSKDPQLALYVELVVTATLGTNWRYAQEDRFDERTARQSLEFYRVEDVPTVSRELPPGVSQVHFVSDLTHVTPADPTLFKTLGDLFSAFS